MGQNLIDFKNFLQSEKLGQFAKGLSSGISHGLTGYLGTYEKRVKTLVRDLDLKSRDARDKSKEQLDRFASQLKSTRTEVEKRVVTLVNHEAERLNKGFNELVAYLKTLSKQEAEQKMRATKSKGKKSAKSAASGTKKKKSGTSKKRSTRSAGATPTSAPVN